MLLEVPHPGLFLCRLSRGFQRPQPLPQQLSPSLTFLGLVLRPCSATPWPLVLDLSQYRAAVSRHMLLASPLPSNRADTFSYGYLGR